MVIISKHMDSCPLCGTAVSSERPRYRAELEIEDTTRSTQRYMSGETTIKRVSTESQLCCDCWDDLRLKLS